MQQNVVSKIIPTKMLLVNNISKYLVGKVTFNKILLEKENAVKSC